MCKFTLEITAYDQSQTSSVEIKNCIEHRPRVDERPVWIQSTSQSTLSSLLELNFRDMTVDLHLLRMIRFLPNAAQANLYIYVHGAPE